MEIKVCDKIASQVKGGSQLLQLLQNQDVYNKNAGGQVIAMSQTAPSDKFEEVFANGLVGSVTRAYNLHHNLILRPDHFFVSIMTQFSAYMNANSANLRSTFVEFEGKKQLVVKTFANPATADYGKLTQAMSQEILKHLKPETKDFLLPNFSTTTDNDRTTCAAVFMGAMQHYFSYKMELCCGIPKVTLQGTVEDYEMLAKHVDGLLRFNNPENNDILKWHQMLRPICDHLISIVRGTPICDNFWSYICNYISGGSGPSYLSGWIGCFCCFDDQGHWQVGKLNHCQELGLQFPKINTNDVPSGLISVPLIIDDNGTEHETCLIAGSAFYKIHVDLVTIEPQLTWFLALVSDKVKAKKQKELRKQKSRFTYPTFS